METMAAVVLSLEPENQKESEKAKKAKKVKKFEKVYRSAKEFEEICTPKLATVFSVESRTTDKLRA